MIIQLLVMSIVLAGTTFLFGMMPLLWAFSKAHMDKLNAVAMGLLLGTALGVIIPEGLETISDAFPDELPLKRIALCLIVGFLFMHFVEEVLSPGAHSHGISDLPVPVQSSAPVSIEFDAELVDMENAHRGSTSQHSAISSARSSYGLGVDRERAFALLLGLVCHAAADGVALGAASLTSKGGHDAFSGNAVSFIVFLALALHKAPTALAFTISLLSTNLPRQECKKYLAIFCASTPLAAILTYFIFTFIDTNEGSITGMALLVSGGTFLYVATVLQPVSDHNQAQADLKPIFRVLLVAMGMFVPLILSTLLGHHH